MEASVRRHAVALATVNVPFAALYTAAVMVGRATAGTGGNVSLIWPAAGVGALWVLVAARRRSGVALATLLLGATAALLNTATGSGAVLGVIFGIGNAAQALVTYRVLRRTQARRGHAQWWRLRGVVDFGLLVVAVLVGGIVALAFGPVAVAANTGSDYVPVASIWLFRNAVGALVLAPLVLRVFAPSEHARADFVEAWGRRRGELLAVMGATVTLYPLIYGLTSDFILSFLPIMISVWAAMRLHTIVAGTHTLLVSAAIVGFTLAGTGPFASLAPDDRSLVAQAYVAAYVLFTWMISVQRDELEGLIRDLQLSRSEIAEQAELLGTVIASSKDAITVFDATGHAVIRNQASRDLFSRIPEGADAQHPSVAAMLSQAASGASRVGDLPLARALRGEAITDTDVEMCPALDSSNRILNVNATPLPSVAGTAGGAVITARDVTEERAAQAAIVSARDDYAMLLGAATQQAILACGPDGTIRVANRGAESVLGLGQDDLLGTQLATLHDPQELTEVAEDLGVEPWEVHGEFARTRRSEALRWRMAVPGAKVVSMTITETPDGGFLCVASDATEQVENEARLRASEARFREAFDTAPVSMFILSLDEADLGAVQETNTTATAFARLDRGQLVGRAFDELVHGDDGPSVRRWLSACAEGRKQHVRTEVRFSHADTNPTWGLVSASVVDAEQAAGGRSRYLLCIVEDVTARKAAEDALVRQALHDDLTDLPNRVLLNDRLEFALRAIVMDPEIYVGILFCDLDGFKDVNDAYGHGTGDEVLREVARRFARTVGPHDTVARLGGDEFAVICPDVRSDEPVHVLATRLIDSLRDPIVSTRGTHHLGVSIGVVLGDRDDQVEPLLARADAAMYEAKRAGKNRFHTYDAALLAKSMRATRLLPELTSAFENGEFVVFGQPVVSLRTGAVESLETLIRWQSPERGIVPPGEFLDVIESSNLMVRVGTYVLRESCRIAATWPAAADGTVPAVHVNVSGKQLTDGDFTQAVYAALEETGLDASRLILELTETHMPQLTLPLLSDLSTLRESGVRIALDDLGTGYSSLARLTELPIDVLKIDRAFVQGMGADDRCDAVVRAVVGMGEAMGVDVVAEGVETPAQAAELARLRCAYGQGYLYSRPRPEAELAAIVSTTYDVVSGAPQHSSQASRAAS